MYFSKYMYYYICLDNDVHVDEELQLEKADYRSRQQALYRISLTIRIEKHIGQVDEEERQRIGESYRFKRDAHSAPADVKLFKNVWMGLESFSITEESQKISEKK